MTFREAPADADGGNDTARPPGSSRYRGCRRSGGYVESARTRGEIAGSTRKIKSTSGDRPNRTQAATPYHDSWRRREGGGVDRLRWILVAGAVLTALNPVSAHAQLFSLGIDPVTPTTLYAETQGVWKSVDGGATWNISGLTDREQYSLAIDPPTPQSQRGTAIC
jgi:hypothetical protein